VASVFKIGGNALSKPIGVRAKSVRGADETNTTQGSNKKLKGILFDRFQKIPEPIGNKLNPNWITEDRYAEHEEHGCLSKTEKRGAGRTER